MPVDPFQRLARGITLEMRRFVRDAGRRRDLPLTAFAGVPGAERPAWPHDPGLDPVLRVDLVERAIDGVPQAALDRGRACVWVTRPGSLEVGARDLTWLAAGQEGFARHALDLPAFFVVGRYGWHEVLSGRSRTWTRVRRGQTVG